MSRSETNSKIARSRIIKSGRTQAVRLPKAVAFPDDVREVEIFKIGETRVISPIGRRWDDYFLRGPRVSDDFMVERVDPPPQKREEF